MMKKGNSDDDDKSTLSNHRFSRARSVEWKAVVDFDMRHIAATAIYDIEIIDSGCSSIQMDTRGLDIMHIELDGDTVKDWHLDEEIKGKPHLGQRLTIPLHAEKKGISFDGEKVGSGVPHTSVKVLIQYKTSSDPGKCTAAQWLTPTQTSGKSHPYLFTQCQAIHARSILPCYDCPAVKMTYTAEISVPKWATAVMSALPFTEKTIDGDQHDIRTFYFEQPVPIPAYLIALAVGDLASKDLSPRCRIWSEPCILDAAADEFHQTELFLQTAEKITSMPYAWGRYDLLVLPGSFPYGGMENPCLTFVTPTLLAEDGSLVCVVAHEIAHSWTGNLVTNKTWGHFWLNEGWTTWLQRRIMNRIENVPHDMDLDAIGGALALEQDIELLDESMTRLVLKLDDSDPDETYSRVAYEKGFHLLYALERLVGEETFLELVAAYLKEFAYGTVTSEEFRDFCTRFWKDRNADAHEKVSGFDWDKWLYGTGMPPLPPFNKVLSEAAESLAKSWIDFDQVVVNQHRVMKHNHSIVDPPNVDIREWTSAQKICFLDALLKLMQGDSKAKPKKLKLDILTIQQMQKLYGFHESHNAEILFRYCMIAIQSEDSSIYPIVKRFITSQGRMKYIRPLYRAMFASPSGRKVAVDTFLKNKDFYHPIAAKMIAYDMTRKQSTGLIGKIKGFLNNRNDVPPTYVYIGLAAVVSLGAHLLTRSKKK